MLEVRKLCIIIQIEAIPLCMKRVRITDKGFSLTLKELAFREMQPFFYKFYV